MNENQQITYMQVRLVRLATEKWNIPLTAVSEIFEKYDIFRYIRENFGILHVEGDLAVLDDINQYLICKGVDAFEPIS